MLGRATASCAQAPVRVCEGALPGPEEKHAAAQNAVCAIELVDGTAPVDSNAGMSASKSREIALHRAKRPQYHLKDGPGKPKSKASGIF